MKTSLLFLCIKRISKEIVNHNIVADTKEKNRNEQHESGGGAGTRDNMSLTRQVKPEFRFATLNADLNTLNLPGSH